MMNNTNDSDFNTPERRAKVVAAQKEYFEKVSKYQEVTIKPPAQNSEEKNEMQE